MAGRRIGRRTRLVKQGPVDGAEQSTAADLESAARNLCLCLLTARARSRAELATALSRKGIPTEVSERVLDRLGDVGLVDDAAFAALVVRSGQRNRSLGRRALSAELRRHGIAGDTADEAVALVDTETEEGTARALVARKLRTVGGADQATQVRRLVATLARKGYPEGLAYRVVREALRERDAEFELSDPEHTAT